MKSTDMEGKEPKKDHKKMEKGTMAAIALALLLGLGVGYLAGKDENKPEIKIERCSGIVD